MSVIQFAKTAVLVLILVCVSGVTAAAQNLNVPGFWDPNVIVQKPGKLNIQRLKFLTTTDFPPFNFIDRRKRLSGFHVDLAREICRKLDVLKLCQVQALPWAELEAAMEKREGDVLIAGLQKSPQSEKKFLFTKAYFHIPGRFTAPRVAEKKLAEPLFAALFRKKTGVVKGSSHAAYFQANFAEREMIVFPALKDAHEALQKGEVDAVFADAVSQVYWLASSASNNCCELAGGPYLSQEYFGEGMRLAVGLDQPELVEALDFALRKINDSGKFRELYLRYFPVSPF